MRFHCESVHNAHVEKLNHNYCCAIEGAQILVNASYGIILSKIHDDYTRSRQYTLVVGITLYNVSFKIKVKTLNYHKSIQ